MHWHPFTKWWLLWGFMFAVIEGTAIYDRRKLPGGSLSSLVWRFLDPTHPVRLVLGSAFIILLMTHFIFRWPDI